MGSINSNMETANMETVNIDTVHEGSASSGPDESAPPVLAAKSYTVYFHEEAPVSSTGTSGDMQMGVVRVPHWGDMIAAKAYIKTALDNWPNIDGLMGVYEVDVDYAYLPEVLHGGILLDYHERRWCFNRKTGTGKTVRAFVLREEDWSTDDGHE